MEKSGKKTLCIDLRWIDSSGVGTYIRGILPGIVEKLQDVSIVGLGDRARLEVFEWGKAANVRLIDCGAGRYSLSEQIQLPFLIPSKTDLFFSPYYTIPLLYRGELAVTVHDMSHLVVQEIVNDRKKRTYAQIMYRALRRRAKVIFTVSEFSKSELVRLTYSAREDNIIPTHLGISPQWFDASESRRLRERPYFVCVGNIKPYKNLGRLIEAFLRVKDRIEHDLVIVGQSEGLITGESPDFFQKVKEAGERVHMVGFVTESELLSLVGHARGLIMPSLYEGFGLPPLEAMAAGVPVAVARAASLPEVCGEAALYFDPLNVEDIGNSIVELAMNQPLWMQLREMGIQRSRRFSWDSCATLTANALNAQLQAG